MFVVREVDEHKVTKLRSLTHEYLESIHYVIHLHKTFYVTDLDLFGCLEEYTI